MVHRLIIDGKRSFPTSPLRRVRTGLELRPISEAFQGFSALTLASTLESNELVRTSLSTQGCLRSATSIWNGR